MKIVTKLTVVATLATFMFAGMNLTWGNAYTNEDATGLTATHSFGVWIDLNDAMAFGWEGGGLKAGFDGPAGMQVRLGFNPRETVGATWVQTPDGGDPAENGTCTDGNGTEQTALNNIEADCDAFTTASFDIATSIGMSRTWWESAGDGWSTNLSTAIDWGVVGAGEGDFTMTLNLGFGF